MGVIKGLPWGTERIVFWGPMRVTDSGEKPNKSHEEMKSNGMEVVSFFSVLFFPSLSSPLPNFSLSLCSQIQKEGSHEIDREKHGCRVKRAVPPRAWKSYGRRSLVGYSPWGCKESDTTSLSLFIFMHWRRKWQPTPVLLPGESQGQGSLVGCHLWGRTESDTTEAT